MVLYTVHKDLREATVLRKVVEKKIMIAHTTPGSRHEQQLLEDKAYMK